MHLSRRQILILGALVLVPVGTLLSLGRSSAAPVAAVYAEDGIAIRGTDPVAYFTQGAAVAGDPSIFADWNGARWHFASAANRDRFAADPAAFAPQFGGYCSWAVAQGYTASIDPDAWRIVEGRLYLNYSASVQRKWAQDVPGNIAKASQNWPGLQQ